MYCLFAVCAVNRVTITVVQLHGTFSLVISNLTASHMFFSLCLNCQQMRLCVQKSCVDQVKTSLWHLQRQHKSPQSEATRPPHARQHQHSWHPCTVDGFMTQASLPQSAHAPPSQGCPQCPHLAAEHRNVAMYTDWAPRLSMHQQQHISPQRWCCQPHMHAYTPSHCTDRTSYGIPFGLATLTCTRAPPYGHSLSPLSQAHCPTSGLAVCHMWP
jgi:hypothetical protein